VHAQGNITTRLKDMAHQIKLGGNRGAHPSDGNAHCGRRRCGDRIHRGVTSGIVGTGSATQRVAIYDEGLSGKTLLGNPGISYSLILPITATGKLTLFESIGADGQQGVSRKAESGVADESTVVNGGAIAGLKFAFNDSDWNGSAGRALAQLWDDIGHDITAATPKGTTTLDISIKNQGETVHDCMTPVANIVQVQ